MADNWSEYIIKIAVLEAQVASMKENIALQAKEYERRLTELNHSHKRQMDRNAEYVSRETWELRNTEMDKWCRAIDQWRWISIGAGIAGGGMTAVIIRLIAGIN